MADPSTPARVEELKTRVMSSLIFADHLRSTGNEDRERWCMDGLHHFLAAEEAKFGDKEFAPALTYVMSYLAKVKDWEGARHYFEKYLDKMGSVPLSDRDHVEILALGSAAYFGLGDFSKLEALLVEIAARRRAICGTDSPDYQRAMKDVSIIREHKMFAQRPRNPLRNTFMSDDGETVVLPEMPDPLLDLRAAYHGRKTYDISKVSPGADESQEWNRRAAQAAYFSLCIFYVYAIAAAGDLAISTALDLVFPYLRPTDFTRSALSFAIIGLTGYTGFKAGTNVANLHTPFVVEFRREGDLILPQVQSLKLDVRGWAAGLALSAVALAAVVWGGISIFSPSCLTAGVAIGWICSFFVREINNSTLKRQIETADFLLFLRRFGTGALFRWHLAQPGIIAIFDESRRDYWKPNYLARMFFTWRSVEYAQVAVAGESWIGAVWSLATSAGAIVYDLEDYDRNAATSLSGLMLEAELFLFLSKPVVFLARRRHASIPDWVPTPLLVLTEGKTTREIGRQFGTIILNRFDEHTKHCLDLHKAKILEELNYVRELRKHKPNPISAVLATDDWSPQTAWRD